MRYTERGPEEAEAEALKLRQEVESLRRQLREHQQNPAPHASARTGWRPSSATIWGLGLLVTVLIVAAFFAGYIPLRARDTLVRNEASEEARALPRVDVIRVGRASSVGDLELPGNIQAITEAPILARADGYLAKRMVDIGDRVQNGQILAEIAAPELDEQVRQAKAAVQQAQSALDQATANLEQGKSNMEIARVTAERWAKVVARGGVSKQENDQYQAQYQGQIAAVQSLEKAVAAQRSNVAQAEANLAHIDEVQGYRIVKAPFAGVITQRNVDTGALVNSGNTMLYRIAQTGTLRTYISVPQTDASSIKVGQPAHLTVSNLPGRQFIGSVARTASALDPASRTMLVEIQVPNADGALLPGMYAQVRMTDARTSAPVLVPGDALQVGADGTKVAVLRPDNTVHFATIEVGRDYGDRLEVLSGLSEGDTIIPRPGDAVREGMKVEPVLTEKPAAGAGRK
ncbi:MAG TPA: efflux RND transporter periplasmic adaptor subunit [Bryobacteraceae bacterium]|jgi:RND family efflux transporter MFP subunit|nr:efflux RND transporter periplasmic adaptor subunit [Bryobacteraceae bacterium]